MGKGGDAPTPPDPQKTSQDQFKWNIQAAQQQQAMNRANLTNPFGTTTWNGNTQTVALSPELQALQASLTGSANSLNATALNPNDYTGQAATNAVMQRLQPQLDLAREQKRNELINSGFDVGSAGFENGMDEYNRAVNDLRLGAVTTGSQVGAQQYGVQSAARSLPIAQLGAVGALAPNPQAPPQVSVMAPDYSGNVNQNYQDQLYAWQQQQANDNALMGGLFSLGGAALGAGLMPGGFLLPSTAGSVTSNIARAFTPASTFTNTAAPFSFINSGSSGFYTPSFSYHP